MRQKTSATKDSAEITIEQNNYFTIYLFNYITYSIDSLGKIGGRGVLWKIKGSSPGLTLTLIG